MMDSSLADGLSAWKLSPLIEKKKKTVEKLHPVQCLRHKTANKNNLFL